MSNSDADSSALSFFGDILKPGSSLHPTFLFILDGAFIFLLLVLLSLAYLTSGNIHIFALTGIELALWASVKWTVKELKNMQNDDPMAGQNVEDQKSLNDNKKHS